MQTLLIPEDVVQTGKFCTYIPVGNADIVSVSVLSYYQMKAASPGIYFYFIWFMTYLDRFYVSNPTGFAVGVALAAKISSVILPHHLSAFRDQ